MSKRIAWASSLAASGVVLLLLSVVGCASFGRPSFESQFPIGVRPAPNRTDGASANLDVRALKQKLSASSPDFVPALKTFFGTTYSQDLVDLVVYIPAGADQPIRSELLWKEKVRQGLPGQRYVWLVVFAEQSDALEAEITSLDYQGDTVLRSLLGAFAAAFGGTGVEAAEPTSAAQDSVYTIALTPLHRPRDSERLYVGLTRMDISEDTMNRVSIRRASGRPFNQGQSYHHNFPNGERSPFSLSVGGGATFHARSQSLTPDSTDVRPNRYQADVLLLLSWDLCRALNWASCTSYPPWRGRFYGLSVGSNLWNGGAFDSAVVGLTAGRLYHDAGLLMAANYSKERTISIEQTDEARVVRNDSRRKWRLLLGLTYTF